MYHVSSCPSKEVGLLRKWTYSYFLFKENLLGASSHIPWLVLAKLSKRQRLRFKRSLQEIPLWLAQRALPSLRNYQYHKPENRAYSLSSQDVCSVRFINHAPEPLQSPSFFQSGRIATNLQPSNRYALKKSSGKSDFLLGSKRNNIFLQPISIKWCKSRSKRYHCMYESPGCRSP